jgi:phage terminase large subunit
MAIDLPYNFKARDYQMPVINALEGGMRRAVALWHRRSGKEKTFFNYTIKKMFDRVGAYYYFFPTYRQGKKILWEGIDRDGFKFMDHFPPQVVRRKHDSDMLVETINGSIFQIIGTDKIDSIVGTNPVGAVFSEFSLQDPLAWDYTRPILAENEGWGVFNFTPRGKNHGHNIFKLAQEEPGWYCEKLTVEDTGAISQEILEQERKEIIKKDGNDALFMQEYYCSFEVPIQGSYYGTQLMLAEQEGRVGNVPYEPDLPVNTAWDLGIGDSTAIWFYQSVGREIRLIDYYETMGEPLVHYVRKLQEKGYVYGDHYAPHDIEVRDLSTGKSRLEVARNLGVRFRVVPKLSVEDGIESVRNILARCWFDEKGCEKGLSALRSYHREYDEKNQTYKVRPKHDWSSHGADAFRYLAVGFRERVDISQFPKVELFDDKGIPNY